MEEQGLDISKKSKDWQIGYHYGCLGTLTKEKIEFSKILGIVDQLLQMHIGALKELGIDVMAGSNGVEPKKTTKKATTKKKKPIEDLL
jgi:hypothetical protein